jgi:hypothetical protein
MKINLRPPLQMAEDRGKKQNGKHEKENLCDTRRSRRDSCKSKNRREDCNDKEPPREILSVLQVFTRCVLFSRKVMKAITLPFP